MYESIRSLRWSWIGFGWFLAVAVASLLLLALASFDLIGIDSPGETLWVAAALLVSFLLTGIFVGTRVVAAPTLHGVGMGLFSLAAWVGVNLVVGEPLGQTTWRAMDAATAAGLLLVQGAAAVVGARIGVRWMRTPPPSL